jgi:biotin transport system substrate-specific component
MAREAVPMSWRVVARRVLPAVVFAALIALGGFIRVYVPGNPVPFTLQVLFVLLAGACLAPGAGLAAVSIFLTAGLFGAPVFAGGGAGAAYLMGPTGGYLLGFLLAAPLISLLVAARRASIARVALAMGAGVMAIHGLGSLHLALYFGGAFGLAWSTTMQFLPLDLVKIAAAAAIVAGGSSWVRRAPDRA